MATKKIDWTRLTETGKAAVKAYRNGTKARAIEETAQEMINLRINQYAVRTAEAEDLPMDEVLNAFSKKFKIEKKSRDVLDEALSLIPEGTVDRLKETHVVNGIIDDVTETVIYRNGFYAGYGAIIDGKGASVFNKAVNQMVEDVFCLKDGVSYGGSINQLSASMLASIGVNVNRASAVVTTGTITRVKSAKQVRRILLASLMAWLQAHGVECIDRTPQAVLDAEASRLVAQSYNIDDSTLDAVWLDYKKARKDAKQTLTA